MVPAARRELAQPKPADRIVCFNALYHTKVVPAARLELAQPKPADFKSAVSTDSTKRAIESSVRHVASGSR